MSDKLTVALALVPMCAGVILVGILQRPAARGFAAEGPASSTFSPTASERRPSDDLDSFPGVVIAAQSAEVAAEADGRISRILARSGARLKRGEPILEIDRSDINTGVQGAVAEREQHRSDELRAEARRQRARDGLARMERGGDWLSAQEIDIARSELRVAEAELSAARSATAASSVRLKAVNLRAQRHVVVAPFEGVLASSDLDVGDSVMAGQVLARVVSDERRVRFGMPREYVPRDGRMDVSLQLGENAPRVEASVLDVRPEVDSAAQLVFAVARPRTSADVGPDWVLGARVVVRPTHRQPRANPER
ncbi:MAG: HlyD family efflux transporter periplasmic adaptor subunit [Polyangiales bacterium]